MLRTFKILVLSGLLMGSLSTANAFSLLGPVSVDTWQVPEIGYMLTGRGVDKGAPKNLGEEYRWNTPILYYSFDQSFLDYFGSNGVRAVSQAFNVFNALTNASAVKLPTVPVAVKKQNYRAQAAQLLDLKSETMGMLIEQLGLADPIRYVWTLQARFTPAGVTCPGPGMEYLVISRNFDADPSSLDMYQSTNRVNGVLYTYLINETCVAPNPLAVSQPVSPDPYFDYSPVASRRLRAGDFYIGLTRDDVGGLRYLLSSNNINYEAVVPGVELMVTNLPTIINTSNLVQLLSDSVTNGPAAFQGLYPNIQISSYTSQFTNWVTTNYTFYYTNSVWTPGTAPSLVLVALTNYATNIGTFYQYQFANVITNPLPPYYTNSNPPLTNSYVTVIYTNIVSGSYVNPDQVVTNVYMTNIRVSAISGDYYVLPTNSCGGLVATTNQLSLLFALTNAPEAIPSPPLLITNAVNYLSTSNLAQLISDSSTNGPAALLALYPNIQILNYVPVLTNVITTNYTFYYTNYSWTAGGSPPVLVALTNYTTNIGTYYQYQFGNVVTNPAPPDFKTSRPPYTNVFVTVVSTNIVAGPYVTPDQVVTNVYITTTNYLGISGDYYILPPATNPCSDRVFSSNQLSLLISTTNAPEAIPAPQLIITNPINFLTTSNLAQLVADASTNGPAALQALYPTLQITNYTSTFTNIITTNLTPFYTNYPWSPVGLPPLLAFVTNYTTNIGFLYHYKFGNVYTNTHYASSLVTVLVTNVTQQPWGNPGVPVVTNVYLSNYWANVTSGDYVIVPTNGGCGGYVILSNILSQLTIVTNGTILVTNAVPGSTYTNTYYSETTTTYFTNHNLAYYQLTCYSNPFASSETRITYFTNRNLAYYPITCYSNPFASSITRVTYFTNRNLKTSVVSCDTNPPGLRRGVEKISFVRRDYDSLVGQTFEPATNYYKLYGVQGSSNVVQNVRRRVTTPDFVILANDLPATNPDGSPTFNMAGRTLDNFDVANKLPNLAGPGTFTPPVVFTYNRVGVVLSNSSPLLGQLNGSRFFTWGSYDGSSTPIYYPNGTSIENLENQIIMQINTANLPDGKVGKSYSAPGPSVVQLTGSGGQPPYLWSQSPSSPGMPPGLSVFSDGTISGVPTQDGTYDIIIRMSDAGARYVEKPYTILVAP